MCAQVLNGCLCIFQILFVLIIITIGNICPIIVQCTQGTNGGKKPQEPLTLSYRAKSSSSSIKGPESKKCFDLSSRFFIPGRQNNDSKLGGEMIWDTTQTKYVGRDSKECRFKKTKTSIQCCSYVLGSWTVCVWNWWTAPADSAPETTPHFSIVSPPVRCSGHNEIANPSQLAGIGETSAVNTNLVSE